MASVLAVVSRRKFERARPGGRQARPGDRLLVDGYTSSSARLRSLEEGGDLYLVTFRPDDRLWLVAVLRGPRFSEGCWRASQAKLRFLHQRFERVELLREPTPSLVL